MRKLYDLARGVAELEVSGAQPERILNYLSLIHISEPTRPY